LTQKDFCFVHNDIKLNNILYTNTRKGETYDINGKRLTLPPNSAHYYIADFGLSHKYPTYGINDWTRAAEGILLPYPLLYLTKDDRNAILPLKGPNADIW
jgi:serine/threonine protein kinase